MTFDSDAERNTVISLRILALRGEGKSLRDAIDEVCGAGSYMRLVSALHAAANANR